MRNYILLWWIEIWYSVDDINYNRRVWVGETEEQTKFRMEFYLQFLRDTFDPAYHIFQMWGYGGPDVDHGPPVIGPTKYYFEMDKANVFKLLDGPDPNNNLVAQCADTIFGSYAFGDVMQTESPRKEWSHGH